jgi:hypothetical protein
MNSHTDDLITNEEINENDDGEEDEDDPFSMAVKELSETNRQADEIARVRNFYFISYQIFLSILIILATFHTITTTCHTYHTNHTNIS